MDIGRSSVNPMLPYFASAKLTASNVPQPDERGNYTAGMFREDFPQFFQAYKMVGNENEYYKSLVPDSMLELFVTQANDSILPSRWGSMWRYAAGLYTAHFAALYLQTYSEGSSDPAAVAQNAQQTGVVKSTTMGDTSVSYDNTAVTSGIEKWGAWNATKYGQQLITYARLTGMGGMWCG